MSASTIINGEKINKTKILGIAEIVRQGGACIVSQWTNGSGRRTTRRTTPAFCEELVLWVDERGADFTVEYYNLSGYAAKAVRKIMKAHPKASAAIVCTNIRGARKALKFMGAA